MSRNKRNLNPQIPGQAPVQAPVDPVADQAEQPASAQEELPPSEPEITGEQVIEPTADQAPEAPEVVRAPVQPQTKQINPKTLKQPVLTNEGWVCPEV